MTKIPPLAKEPGGSVFVSALSWARILTCSESAVTFWQPHVLKGDPTEYSLLASSFEITVPVFFGPPVHQDREH